MAVSKQVQTVEPQSTESDGIVRFLNADGELLSDRHSITDDKLVELFRDMIRTRTFDEAVIRLQRIGRIPAYYPCAGQ